MDADEDDQSSTSDGELSDYVPPPLMAMTRGPTTRASGRILRNSQSTTNAHHLLRSIHLQQPVMGTSNSQLPRPPALTAAQVARSQSASRLTMVGIPLSIN